MRKPKVFIGSSVEGLELARAAQTALDYDADSTIWAQQVFSPSHFPLEALETTIQKSDFSIFICTPDDDVTTRDCQRKAIRDNIVFEVGLSIGILGRKRTFLLAPRPVTPQLPSDLSGITPETYDLSRPENLEAALGPACTRIRNAMRLAGLRDDLDGVEIETTLALVSDNGQEGRLSARLPSDRTHDDFFDELFDIVAHTDLSRLDGLDRDFRNSLPPGSDEVVAEWESKILFYKCIFGKDSDLDSVRTLSERFPRNSRIQANLAHMLSHYGDKQSAISLFLDAADNCSSIDFLASITHWVSHIPDKEKVVPALLQIEIIARERFSASSGHSLSFLDIMTTVCDSTNRSHAARCIDELKLSISPDRMHDRFNLAYKYSDGGQNALAFLHYNLIPPLERTPVAWNNIGVALERLGAPGQSVDAYERAAALGETLASVNLARRFLNAGFHDKARSIVESVLSVQNYNESAPDLLTSIKSSRVSEASKIEDSISISIPKQSFFLTVGKAALHSPILDICGEWDTHFGRIEITRTSINTYTALAIVPSGPQHSLFSLITHTEKIRISLQQTGSAFEGLGTYETSPSASESLGLGSVERRFLLVAENEDHLAGFETMFGDTQISWKKSAKLLQDQSV